MDRYKSTKKASILGIIGNVFLLIIKGIIGFMTNSQAMIADSVNSAGDIFSSCMTFIGNKIASKPSDESHNLGHGKAEYIFSLLISLSMIFVAIKLLIDSVQSLKNPEGYTFSWFLIVVCIVTIATKLGLYIYTHSLSKKYNNLLIEANANDHRNDCVVTTFNLIAALLSLKHILWFDGVVGIGISLWICYTGIQIFIESYNVLMDISVDDKTKDLILDIAHSYKEIKNVVDIVSTPVGDRYLVFITINLDGNMSTFESHNLADSLEKNVNALDKIYKTVVHVDPI